MPAKSKKIVVGKFPLRLMPSVREGAEDFSRKEGVSLNQFINVAVAEKLAHLQHEEWLSRRRKPTPEGHAQAMAFFNRPKGIEPDPEDQLPDGYVSIASGGDHSPGRRYRARR